MIFIDKIIGIEKILNPEINKLIDLAMKNQSHSGDLLLLIINGFYDEDRLEFNNNSEIKYSPFLYGPSVEGHVEQTHYSFINNYRKTNISQDNFTDYLKLHEWTIERKDEINNLVEIEETGIHIEMLIYLKFWEADMIIKKLYQFVRILNGQHYDWFFKVSESSRDKNSTGKRLDIINKKIRDGIKENSNVLFNIIKDTYKTQLRNSIAHSNYSFLGRNVHLNNYIKDDKFSQLKCISFNQWIDIFHNTLVLHNQYLRINNIVHERYKELALQNNNEIEIRTTNKESESNFFYVKYNIELDDWN